ncbi:hypothetical protein L2735_00675 [Shewanella olleyana]|uniref:hypothetical protein n=1 Tax=Shewanella olleyana TaxID=135626 RepID=UPI00200DC3EF|nr:hypothetical protein [Shewanella olleyana]MCL1065340.1 hypothetical protein [Shewanella olleyana]
MTKRLTLLLPMKLYLIIFTISVSSFVTAVEDESQVGQLQSSLKNPLIGSWELISGEYLNDKNQWVDYQGLNLEAIKVISNKHFSFTTIKNNSGVKEFWAAGTGSYQLTEQHYIEFPTLNSFNVKEGGSFTFSYQIIGNEWHTKRYEGGELAEKEIWKRLR